MLELTEEKGISREHKDRLFKMIFGRPENREWTLSLYNALYQMNLESRNSFKITGGKLR